MYESQTPERMNTYCVYGYIKKQFVLGLIFHYVNGNDFTEENVKKFQNSKRSKDDNYYSIA